MSARSRRLTSFVVFFVAAFVIGPASSAVVPKLTTISGKFASDGSAGGTASVPYTFGPGPNAGIDCTSNGIWSARPSS